MSLKQYETVFILTPVLSDQQMKDTALKFKQYLLDQGAKIVNEESWGLKKLAYTIDHKNTGFYHLLQFESDPQLIKTFEVEFRRDERVMRFLTVSLDKYALAYSKKRKNGEFKKSVKEEASV
ncbi:MAG: 30S ribosomal protein S6 [Cytophagaceae bacterium]|nr:30S ribosomal protein S6 [Cytophagaceae bacterium]